MNSIYDYAYLKRHFPINEITKVMFTKKWQMDFVCLKKYEKSYPNMWKNELAIQLKILTEKILMEYKSEVSENKKAWEQHKNDMSNYYKKQSEQFIERVRPIKLRFKNGGNDALLRVGYSEYYNTLVIFI